MVSELARGDYEDLLAAGLPATLEDFDRLNQLALRLTDGAETTAANFPRIGWAGDVPFYQPTCAAFTWYLEFVERADFSAAEKDAAWFYALAHGREPVAFDGLTAPARIREAVNLWLSSLPVTRAEIARAARFAAVGFEDAQPGRVEDPAAKTAAERREVSLANLSETVSVAAALSGIAPATLAAETPSRLKRMIEAVRDLHIGGGANKAALQADYDLAFREIRRRLIAEKEKHDGQGH